MTSGVPMLIRIAGAVLFLLSLVTVGISVNGSIEQRRTNQELHSYVECKAAYDDRLNERSRRLTEANEEERAAERHEKRTRAELFTNPAILKSVEERTPAEVEELRGLAIAWQRALTEEQIQQMKADRERAANPVPPPPSEVCRLDEE